MTDEEAIKGIRRPGPFDAVVESGEKARRLVRTALPHAIELPPGEPGLPYPSPSPGTGAWYQHRPAEPGVGNDLPHVKYADWTAGKKGRGGSWGHLFFPPGAAEGA
jgi:hypothetical protein